MTRMALDAGMGCSVQYLKLGESEANAEELGWHRISLLAHETLVHLRREHDEYQMECMPSNRLLLLFI